jgi:chemotaxis signal transduction protein
MLRGQRKQTVERAVTWSVIVFFVGGRPLAARTEEVGGIRPWSDAMPVPSRTPSVNALIRYGEEVFPVFDLAGFLKLRVQGSAPLCLIAKRRDGRIALRIDTEMPRLLTVEAEALNQPAEPDSNVLGLFLVEGKEVPIYSLANLGLPTIQTS